MTKRIELLLKILFLVGLFLFGGVWGLNKAHAADIYITWDLPADIDKNPDGIKGYRMYQSASSGIYDKTKPVADVPYPTNEAYVQNIADGNWFFVVTAYDGAGNESGFSNEVSTGILDTTPPQVPTGIKIKQIIIKGAIKPVSSLSDIFSMNSPVNAKILKKLNSDVYTCCPMDLTKIDNTSPPAYIPFTGTGITEDQVLAGIINQEMTDLVFDQVTHDAAVAMPIIQ